MKRKFPFTVFVLLIILNIAQLVLYFVNDTNSFTLVQIVVESLFFYLMSGGVIFLALPAVSYGLLATENDAKNRFGYMTAVVALILQICFGVIGIFLLMLSSMYGATYWVGMIFMGIAFVLTIVAIVYSKAVLKLKVFGRK